MRILQVCSARTLGGGERHVAALSNALVERGHTVYVAVAPGSPLRAVLSKIPAENVIELRMRNAFDVPSALKLTNVIRKHEIEIVHAHLARDYPLASLAVRRFAQLVITRHVLFPLNRLHKLTLTRVARLIAVSNAVADSLRLQRICDERKLKVIPNGIDLERFGKPISDTDRAVVRERLGVKTPLLVGTVGSYLPLKGFEEFVRAAAIILRLRDDVEFVIIGDDEPRNRDYRMRIERLVQELCLTERLHMRNWTGDLSPFYQSLDIYVSSSHSEAFGLSIVEAMAGNKAVIATATEGAKEIVKDNLTGVIVPVGDVQKLAEAMARLLEDSNERKWLGVHAGDVARKRFGLDRMVDAIEQVYRDALERT